MTYVRNRAKEKASPTIIVAFPSERGSFAFFENISVGVLVAFLRTRKEKKEKKERRH